MDYQKLAECFSAMTCIISIEKLSDGNFGNIRIVAGNKAYIDSIEDTENHIAANQMVSNKFIPDSPYENYIPKDLNFEEQCYRCAVEKKQIHEYIHPNRYSFWLDIYMMPVESDTPDKFYCMYSQSLTQNADAEIMSNMSAVTTSSVLETCIKLRSSDDFRSAIDNVINDIRRLCDAGMCCIVLTDEEKRQCSVLCQALDKNIKVMPMEQYMNMYFDDFYDVVDSWKKSIAGSTCLILNDENDMAVLKERNPVFYNSMQTVKIDSMVLFPLEHNNTLLGYIWAVNYDVVNTAKIKEILEITTFFLASELSNYQLVNKLEIMSSVDQLTCVYNHNAMIKRVNDFISGIEPEHKSYVVIYADINGLKRMNDSKGHFAGDMLIKNAAEKLTKVFPECDVYRAGGDEFMILAADISESIIEERISKLRIESEDPEGVSMSLGAYCGSGNKNIQDAMRIADERMYEDKNNYYIKYPERKSRM